MTDRRIELEENLRRLDETWDRRAADANGIEVTALLRERRQIVAELADLAVDDGAGSATADAKKRRAGRRGELKAGD